MKANHYYTFFFFISFYGSVYSEENILCTTSYCSDVTCNSTMPERCLINNATHNGVYLPSVEICNCCDYCLANLVEGEACSIGSPSNLKATSVCGPKLYCQAISDTGDGTCQPMVTNCTTLQTDYDTRRKNGYLGTMEVKANCDDDGLFTPYKCIPGQTCYCQDINGTRIFGEAVYSSIDNYMSCECSRKYYDAVQLIGRELKPTEHFRCNAKGDYDPIQCIGSKCMCVDAVDGAPTFPTQDMVNITEISNETLSCYSSNELGEYYKKCEQEYVTVLKEAEEDDKLGYNLVIGYEYPKCDLDGTYQAIQENTTHKFCVDKNGTLLVVVDKTEQADLANSMDCKCIRAISIMTTSENPTCTENGNYAPIQCRRGTCRCVDSNGNQKCSSSTKSCDEVDEIQKETLKC